MITRKQGFHVRIDREIEYFSAIATVTGNNRHLCLELL